MNAVLLDRAEERPEQAVLAARHAHIIEHFNQTHAHYRRLWRLDHNLGMHIGFFDDRHRRHDEAVLNMNRVLAETAGVTAADQVLDLGCGIGGSAVWLAGQFGSRVTGVNINPRQLAMARQLVCERNLRSRVNFVAADFSDTGLPDESCDVVWALESVGYAEDKPRFLDEAFRLLRPGGRIVVADAFLTRARLSLSQDDMDVVGRFERGWALAPLAAVGEFASDMQQAGFERVAPRDVTAHVTPSSQRMYRAAMLLLPFARLLRHLGLCTPMQLQACEAAQAQYAARRRGIGAYVIFSGQKPGADMADRQ